ncbi:MAG: flagellar basal-body MS-ring/collar protein FliF [bacterium]
MNDPFIQKLREQFDKLSRQQKITLMTATAVTTVSLILLLVWANRPEYALLYSKLDAADTAKVTEALKADNIPYKLEDGGRSIFVRKEDVHEIRINFAGEDFISSGSVGYELFDKNNLGLTDFMQKINLKRALEGELVNTISQIEDVLFARVHLAIPEPALFQEQQKKATASVILKLKPRAFLEKKQILGITNLVAASVEGLDPEDVIIVDTLGRVLTKNRARDHDIELSSSQYDLKRTVEEYLSKKAQSMLDKVLGESNSIVRVSAELDFKKVRRTSESVDPENSAVLSEERNEEKSTTSDTTAYQRENTITNFELNKVVEHYESSTGDIKKLSIAVFVNGVYQSPEKPNEQRSQEEIQKITNIVKKAVGFSEERNDQIEVQQLAFDRSLIARENEVIASMERHETIMRYTKIGLGVLGALFIVFGLRKLLKKLGIDEYLRQQRELLLQEAQASLEDMVDERALEEERRKQLEEETRARQELQERVKQEVAVFSAENPELTTRILRYWLLEDEEQE